jgi:hypothetical protein
MKAAGKSIPELSLRLIAVNNAQSTGEKAL